MMDASHSTGLGLFAGFTSPPPATRRPLGTIPQPNTNNISRVGGDPTSVYGIMKKTTTPSHEECRTPTERDKQSSLSHHHQHNNHESLEVRGSVGSASSADSTELMFLKQRQRRSIENGAHGGESKENAGHESQPISRTDKLYLDARRRSAALEKERAEVAAQRDKDELEGCTFIPNTNNSVSGARGGITVRRSRSSSTHSSTTTTSPSRCSSSSKSTKNAPSAATSRQHNGTWHDRLAVPSKPNLERLQKEAAIQELLFGPTFTPNINHNYDATLEEWKAGTEAHERLHGEAAGRQMRRDARRALKEELEMDACKKPHHHLPSTTPHNTSSSSRSKVVDSNDSHHSHNNTNGRSREGSATSSRASSSFGGIPLLVERAQREASTTSNNTNVLLIPPSTVGSRTSSCARAASLRSASAASAKSQHTPHHHTTSSNSTVLVSPFTAAARSHSPPTPRNTTSNVVDDNSNISPPPPTTNIYHSDGSSPAPNRDHTSPHNNTNTRNHQQNDGSPMYCGSEVSSVGVHSSLMLSVSPARDDGLSATTQHHGGGQGVEEGADEAAAGSSSLADVFNSYLRGLQTEEKERKSSKSRSRSSIQQQYDNTTSTTSHHLDDNTVTTKFTVSPPPPGRSSTSPPQRLPLDTSFEPLSPLSEDSDVYAEAIAQTSSQNINNNNKNHHLHKEDGMVLFNASAPKHIDPLTGNVLTDTARCGSAGRSGGSGEVGTMLPKPTVVPTEVSSQNGQQASNPPLTAPVETISYKLYKKSQTAKKARLEGKHYDLILLELARQNNDIFLEMNNRDDILKTDFLTRQARALADSKQKKASLEKEILLNMRTSKSKKNMEGATAASHRSASANNNSASTPSLLERLQKPLKRHEVSKRAASCEMEAIAASRKQFQMQLKAHNDEKFGYCGECTSSSSGVVAVSSSVPCQHANQRVAIALLKRQHKQAQERQQSGGSGAEDAAFLSPYVTRHDHDDMTECTFEPHINANAGRKGDIGGGGGGDTSMPIAAQSCKTKQSANTTSTAAATTTTSTNVKRVWQKPPSIKPRWPKWMTQQRQRPSEEVQPTPSTSEDSNLHDNELHCVVVYSGDASPCAVPDALTPSPHHQPPRSHIAPSAPQLLPTTTGSVTYLKTTALSPKYLCTSTTDDVVHGSEERGDGRRGCSIATVASPMEGAKRLFSPIRVDTLPPTTNAYRMMSMLDGPNHLVKVSAEVNKKSSSRYVESDEDEEPHTQHSPSHHLASFSPPPARPIGAPLFAPSESPIQVRINRHRIRAPTPSPSTQLTLTSYDGGTTTTTACDEEGVDVCPVRPRLWAPHPTPRAAPPPSPTCDAFVTTGVVSSYPSSSPHLLLPSPTTAISSEAGDNNADRKSTAHTAPPSRVGTPTEQAYVDKHVKRQLAARIWKKKQALRLSGRPLVGMWDVPPTSGQSSTPAQDNVLAVSRCDEDALPPPPAGPFPGLSAHEHHYKHRYVSRVKQQLQESFEEAHPFRPFIAPHTQKLADAATATASSTPSAADTKEEPDATDL